MKRMTLILIFFLGFHCVNSQVDRDKALHFLGGNLYGLAGAGIAKQISKGNRWWTFAGAVGGSALIGIGKEAVDAGQSGNGWDNDDLLATILGGATVGVTIDIFTDHKRDKKKIERNPEPEIRPVAFSQSSRLEKLLVHGETPSLRTLGLPEDLVLFNALK